MDECFTADLHVNSHLHTAVGSEQLAAGIYFAIFHALYIDYGLFTALQAAAMPRILADFEIGSQFDIFTLERCQFHAFLNFLRARNQHLCLFRPMQWEPFDNPSLIQNI